MTTYLIGSEGTPQPVIDKLDAGLRVAVHDPAFTSRVADLGAVPAALDQATPQALRVSQVRGRQMGPR